METRANFILIGIFTLLIVIGSLVFFAWLSTVQINRQYAQYGILFENVSGLDPSGDVLFNGVSVGRVTGIRIWEENPSLVFVGIEVDAETPIRADTIGLLRSSGVTGVAYIELSGGSPDAPPLLSSDGSQPIIRAERSTVQNLVADAPDLISDLTIIVDQLQSLTGPENQALVTQILTNLETASGQLETALTDFSSISVSVREATDQISVFTDRLENIGTAVETTLSAADTTLESASRAFQEAETVLKGTAATIESAQNTFAGADQFMHTTLPRVSAQLTATLETIDRAANATTSAFDGLQRIMVDSLDPMASDIRGSVTRMSDALDRLLIDAPSITQEARALIARTDATVASLQTMTNSLSPQVQAFANVTLPQLSALVRDLRSAVTSFSRLTSQVEDNPTGLLFDNRVPDYRR